METELSCDSESTEAPEIILSEESVLILELLAKWGRGLPQTKMQEKLQMTIVHLRAHLAELVKYRLIAHDSSIVRDFRVAPSEQQMSLIWKLTAEGKSLLEVGSVDA